jgi:serine/threonine protein kinase
MRFGKPLQGPVNRAVFSGATTTLRALHAAKLCHTDCRKPNIITFDDGPQLIDFGLARTLGQKVDYAATSHSRAALFPQELKDLLKKTKSKTVSYSWSARDDMEMLGLALTGVSEENSLMSEEESEASDFAAKQPKKAAAKRPAKQSAKKPAAKKQKTNAKKSKWS